MSLIISTSFGSISTLWKNLVVAHKKHFNPGATFIILFLNLALYFCGFSTPFALPDLWHHPLHLITYQFSHENLEHVMSNCMFLALVGPKVEKLTGHLRFTLIYLFTGVFSAIGFSLLNPDVALLGASGAIAGLLMIYPFCQKTIYGHFLTLIPIGFYFVQNFIFSAGAIAGVVTEPTAYLAHVAGGVAGLVLFLMFRRAGIVYKSFTPKGI